MKYYYIFVIILVSLLYGCGHKEGVYTTESKAYVYFSGDTTNISVSIDNGTPFQIIQGRENLYTIESGKHKVSLYRGGILFSEREIYISKGVSKEIEVQ